MLAKSCRLCGCHSLHEGLSINNSPNNVQSLLKIDDLPFDKPIRLEILVCDRCGLVQIDPLLDKAYYDDYLMSTTYSNQMQVYQRQQAKMFVEKFGLHGKAVKEIGCGDGSYLDHLSEAGALPSGIEPSNRFRKLALARGYLVEDGSLTKLL